MTTAAQERGNVKLEKTPRPVVVAVDGSAASTAAVAWAAADAALRHLPVTLAHVAPRWRGGGREEQTILSDAEAVVRTAVGDEVSVETRRLRGRPVAALTKLTLEADRLVIGFRGIGVLGAGLLGPVTEGVLHHARCPVAVIRAGHRDDPNVDRLPVLVGVDGSASSAVALALAFEEAQLRATSLVAIHVVDDGALGPARSTNILQAALEPCLRDHPGVEAHSSLVSGDPSTELINRAESAQLVVIGNRGRGGLARTMLGSVSSAVVACVDAPVLVARDVVPAPQYSSTSSRSTP